MEIMFLCGSLEPGRDGVGDYSRLLASELIRNGHVVEVISINDRYVNQVIREKQPVSEISVDVVRIPKGLPSREKFEIVKKRVADLSPKVVSLQYVLYSYDDKGLPFYLTSYLKALGTHISWHIMFHEIWLANPAGLKNTIISFFQKRIILNCVRQLKPILANVSIELYQTYLTEIGIESKTLELFGNMPLYAAANNSKPDLDLNDNSKRILYFGTPPRDNYLELVVNGLVNFCKSYDGAVTVLLVCGGSKAKDDFLNSLQARLSAYPTKIVDLGFKSDQEISFLMKQSAAGIIRSLPNAIGKSGSAIAMLEHGLPLWLPKWDGAEEIGYGFRKELMFASLQEAVSYKKHHSFTSLLPQVAFKFLSQLAQANAEIT